MLVVKPHVLLCPYFFTPSWFLSMKFTDFSVKLLEQDHLKSFLFRELDWIAVYYNNRDASSVYTLPYRDLQAAALTKMPHLWDCLLHVAWSFWLLNHIVKIWVCMEKGLELLMFFAHPLMQRQGTVTRTSNYIIVLCIGKMMHWKTMVPYEMPITRCCPFALILFTTIGISHHLSLWLDWILCGRTNRIICLIFSTNGCISANSQGEKPAKKACSTNVLKSPNSRC